VTEAAGAPVSPAPTRPLGVPRILLLSSYWVALGFLWLPLGSQVIPGLVVPIVGDSLKGTATAILEGFGTAVAIGWQPVVGSVSDRTRSRFGRRKPYIVLGTVGSAIFLGLMILTPRFGGGGEGGTAALLAPAFLWLLATYLLLQLSENAAQAPYQGLLPDVVPEAERGRASGFVGVGNLVGIGIGVYAAGTFMGMRRPELALGLMAIVLLVSMLVVVAFFPDRVRAAPADRASWQRVVVQTFNVSPRKYPDFLWLMASRLFILVALAGLQRYAVFYFKDVFYGSDPGALEAAQFAGRDLQVVILVVAVLVGWPAAELSHKVGRKPLIVVAGILGALGTVGLIASAHQFLPDAAVTPLAGFLHVPNALGQALYFGILLGLAAGIFLAVDWAFMVDFIPADEAGRFLGFSNIATAGSGVLAGFAGGFLIDIFNARGQLLGQPGGYPVAFGVYLVFFFLGTLAILKVRETRGARADRPAATPLGH
jgi:Na+/melibiose symporter-like transporter